MNQSSTVASKCPAQVTAAVTADRGSSGLAPAAAPEIDPRLPLVIGVTGHRDLRADARAAIAGQVREILLHFKATYPSNAAGAALAAGRGRRPSGCGSCSGGGYWGKADRAAANDAGDLRARFPDRRLACRVRSAAGRGGVPVWNSRRRWGSARLNCKTTIARQDQYAAVGEFVVRHCQVLIALWDGKSGQRGGTGEVVELKVERNSFCKQRPGAGGRRRFRVARSFTSPCRANVKGARESGGRPHHDLSRKRRLRPAGGGRFSSLPNLQTA